MDEREGAELFMLFYVNLSRQKNPGNSMLAKQLKDRMQLP